MENNWLKENWKYVAGIVGVALLYRWLIKPKKGSKEAHSNFLGSPFGKRVMFTLTNNTDKMQVVPLFNAYSSTQNPDVGIMPSISEFNRTLLNEPKLVKMIEIKAQGSTAQAQKPIQIYCKDASGEFQSSYLYPLVSAYQKALDMTTVHPQNLILSGACYMNYTVNPKQTVVMILHYDLEVEPKSIESDSNMKKVAVIK